MAIMSGAAMTTPPSAAGRDLTTLVQNLPQELFDEIFELVVHVEPNEVITITKSYHHPIALHINSAIRREGAKIYYTANTFMAAEGARRDAKRHMCKWVLSLPETHRSMIREIRIPCWDAAIHTLENHGLMSLKRIQLMAIPKMKHELVDWCHPLEGVSLGTLKMKVDLKVDSGEIVWKNWDELNDFYFNEI